MRNRQARIVAAAAIAATSLLACSDGARQEFIDAADGECREADERIREVDAPRAQEELDEYVADAERITADLVSDLRALDPPAADEERIDEMIEGLERAADLLEPLARAVAERDRGALEDLQREAERITEEVSDIAESYGFERCGAKLLDPSAPPRP